MYMRRRKNNNGKFITILYKFLSLVLLVSSVVLFGILIYIDLLPNKYLMIVLAILVVFNLFNIFFINLKRLKRKVKKVLATFMFIGILINIIGSFYLGKTLGVLISNGESKYKIGNYSVIVLKDSKYNEIKDLKNEEIGYFEGSNGSKEANEIISKKAKVELKSYSSSDSLVNDLLDSKINVIVLEDSIKAIMSEEIPNFDSLIKVIFTFNIKTKSETISKEADVTKEPFAIYISGIDTYGQISSVSRSDVNIVAVVNPKIKQVLLISIPRDYYVKLHGTTGSRDKLTHAGIYGIDMSIHTIEDLLDIDINYYIKVNFTSVIDIVNCLGGLDVYSEYTFISYSGYSFKKGMNSVNGEQALDFARTRKAFSDGDRQRGKNQQAVIEAMIRKVSSKSIITKYSSLLSAIDGKYQTNMGMKKITSLIKMQLNDMSPWNVTSYSLTGFDSSNYTYTYNQLLYVMEPDQKSVDGAKELIKSVFNSEKLETSYNDISGSSSKVTRPYSSEDGVTSSTVKKQQEKEEEKETKKEEVKEIEKEESEEQEENESTENENLEAKEESEDQNNNTDEPTEIITPQPNYDEEDDRQNKESD